MLEAMNYKEVDGLLYPELTMPDETEDLTKLGRYGRMAMKYLLENEPARYKTLMRFGKMYEKMSEVEKEANQLYDQLEEQYLMKLHHDLVEHYFLRLHLRLLSYLPHLHCR